MNNIWVGVGSFIGGVLRYGLNSWVYRLLDGPGFLFGTRANAWRAVLPHNAVSLT